MDTRWLEGRWPEVVALVAFIVTWAVRKSNDMERRLREIEVNQARAEGLLAGVVQERKEVSEKRDE